MTETLPEDPWTRWYAAYRAKRIEHRAEVKRQVDRRRVANRVAGLLVGYMLAGGAIAGWAVKLVMAN